jgi:septum formation protein
MDKHLDSPPLLLASCSRHRRALLERLQVVFESISPAVDESSLAHESPAALAERLAAAKAQAGALQRPEAVVIGSDQVAALGSQILGKPGTTARAEAQLQACSGQDVVFHTAVCVVDPHGRVLTHRDQTHVRFRVLGGEEIRDYVAREQPLDSAGAFRCENLGIALFEHIESRDPTALIGLPLIWLCGALRQTGIPVLGAMKPG